jgi:multiple sugar transport system substrate-binding protein
MLRRRAIHTVLVACALTACRGAEAREQRITLRFWAMGAEGENVQQLVREFEHEHPNVDVRVQQIPWTAAHEKLLTAFVGNVTPDLAQLGNTWVPELQAVDAIMPLDAYVAQSAIACSPASGTRTF